MRATITESATMITSRTAASLTVRRRFWTSLALITTAMTRTSCRSLAGKPSGSLRRSFECNWCWGRWRSREYQRTGKQGKEQKMKKGRNEFELPFSLARLALSSLARLLWKRRKGQFELEA